MIKHILWDFSEWPGVHISGVLIRRSCSLQQAADGITVPVCIAMSSELVISSLSMAGLQCACMAAWRS